jgi:formimidoylglutamate deiminase
MEKHLLNRTLFFDHALLPSGWAQDVRIEIADGIIGSVAADAGPAGAERIGGIAVPGVPNVHCHSFQRAMAGLAERRGQQTDSFWTWREAMYALLNRLSPDDVQAIAAFAYVQMLEAGFTAVGEFHYLHHDPDGRPYADLGEMAGRIAAASAETRIALTLLPSFYAFGGFSGKPPALTQRRCINDPERFLKLLERTRAIVGHLQHARVGIAPHSLRAVTPDTLRAVRDAVSQGRIHIHAAEQLREVDECVAALGARPVEWLIDNMGLDARWCVIHATHTTDREVRALASTGAAVSLCPLTEASLGDGIFDAAAYVAAGGRFGVGSDSNIQIDPAAEMRQLEYGQRLARRARNVMALQEGFSTGRRMFEAALAGGAQALEQPIGAIAPGLRADIVLLDGNHPDFASRRGDEWLDAWIFVVGPAAVRTVLVGGGIVVEDGRHRAHAAIEARYRRLAATLASLRVHSSPR